MEASPNPDAPEEVKTFHADMKKLWETLKAYGVERDNLKGIKPARYFADGADLVQEYQRGWKVHSKYVHPTAYLLFGKKDFVYGAGAKLYFWVSAQYYAARNLHDLHKMIEAIP